MTLRADSQGFLIGELVESSIEQSDLQRIANRSLGGIRTDVSAIARALGVLGRSGRSVSEPTGRGGSGGARATTSATTGSRSMPSQRTALGAANARATASPSGRDSRGRFVSAAGSKGKDVGRDSKGRFTPGDGGDGGDGGSGGSGLGGRLNWLTEAIKGMGNNTEQMDPTLTAMSELKSVVEPLGRGVLSMFKKSDAQKKEGWFKKIIGSLKKIEEKPTAIAGGDSGGTNISLGGGGLLKGAGGLLGGIFKGGAKGAGGLLKGAGGLLKRVPLLGALLAGGGALTSLFGGDDPNLSADENRNEKYKGVGGSVGMGVGGVAGAALGSLFGPVGTFVGGYLGSMAGEVIGEKVGEWTKTLVDADIPGKISKAWDGFVDVAKDRWEAMKGGADALWSDAKNLAKEGVVKAVDLGNKANDAVKNATGVDVKQYAQDKAAVVADAAKKAAVATGEFVSENAPKLVPKSIRRMTDMAGNAGAVLNAGMNAGKMEKGSRKVADFSGIEGGAMMGQNGTYTAAEAERIRLLKSTGQNTGASVKGGMSPEIQNKIAVAAKASGLDPVMMQKMAAMESGGNPNAISKTGAIGLFQFTGKTATGVGIQNRFDADQNIAGGMKLAQENSAMLAAKKLPVTAENLYMMHQLGPKAAMEVINGAKAGAEKSALSPDTQKAMNLNYGAKETTAAGYLATNSTALNTRLATSVAQGPVPVASYAGSSVPSKLPPAPDVQIPNPSTDKDRSAAASTKPAVSQEVGDRGIAHIVGGGIGRPRGW